METKDNVFMDSVDLSDAGPKGFVILTDKNTGKTIFKKHNMVVNKGKEYIFALFAQKNNGNSNNSILSESEYDSLNLNNLTTYKLSFLEFGVGTNDVSPDDTDITHVVIHNSGSTDEYPLKFKIIPASETGNKNNTVKANIVKNEEKFYLKFEFDFEGTILENVSNGNQHLVSELGLFLAKTGGSDLLFSRIRFDTIPITNESSLLLQYYVYF